MDEENVITNILSKFFFGGSDIPVAKLFLFFLGSGQKISWESKLAWWKSSTIRSVSLPTSTVVLKNQKISICSCMVSFAVALLWFCTQHENELLFILLVSQKLLLLRFIVMVMLARTVTVKLAFPFDLLCDVCHMSHLLYSYFHSHIILVTSNTNTAFLYFLLTYSVY